MAGPEILLVATVYFCSGRNAFIDHYEEGCTELLAQDSKGGFGAAESPRNRKSKGEPTQADREAAAQRRKTRQQHCRDYAEWIALGQKLHRNEDVTKTEVERRNLLNQSFANAPAPKCQPS